MNYEKIQAAVTKREQDADRWPFTIDQRRRHVANAGLKELFEQTCAQFTSETGAMNKRLDEMMDKADSRHDMATNAANRAASSAIFAGGSADRAANWASQAQVSADQAEDYAEVAEEGANAVEAATDDSKMELHNMISTQAETIGKFQTEQASAEADIRSVAKNHDLERAKQFVRVNGLTQVIRDRNVRIAELSDTTLNHRVEAQAETIARQADQLQQLHTALTAGCVDSVVRVDKARNILHS